MTGLLIANRGEVAVRVHRAAKVLGLRTVAVYSPEDAGALHVRLADEAHALAGRGVEAYLDVAELVHHARRTGCTLVHPGYGFLSESADLARACAGAGLTFVGPSPETLELFGDKTRARRLAGERGVPVLRATAGPTTLEEAESFLGDLGPGAVVMVKAVHGGGGRGTRVVRSAGELPEAFERCRSEAERSFGNGALYVEQLLVHAKHVEVQVVGDGTDVSCLGERECTVQRRHQKLVEVAPSPSVTPAVREALAAAALRMAAGYSGLGTFEFLLDAHTGDFFFLEANPRLQVEHTVTEEVTGVDLVAAQIEIALGASLAALGLADPPRPRGRAIQARVNLETAGVLTRFEPPTGPGVRVDTHGHAGLDVGGEFDSLLAKVVVHTTRGDFAAAAGRTDAALAELVVEGPATNVPLLRAVLQHPAFRDGSVTTSFVDDQLADLVPEAAPAGSPAGSAEVLASPFTGTVVAVEAVPGAAVAAGQGVVVLEAMKMQHVLPAPAAATVSAVLVEVGDTVRQGEHLVRLTPTEEVGTVARAVAEVDLDHVRPDLADVLARHEVGLDAARPDAVERRHRSGHRTARENVADLCDSFTEYGALVVAAQRQRRSLEDLVANTPADGMVTGLGHVNAEAFGEDRSRCVVLAYDYTVLAGTQGLHNHRKTDRMLELAAEKRLPVVLFAEGGGGRPGDTDTSAASWLDVPTFASMGRLSGLVPTVGIASGRCFAGNAALLGCCDVVIATEDATIGMGGPAMIEGGGLGSYRPEEVGPTSVQVPNGVVDVLVADEAEAVAVARRYLSYFQGPVRDWECADQRQLRHALPENRVRVYDVRRVVEGLADTGSVLELRPAFGVGVVTALVRVEGRPMGLVANNPAHLGGAVDAAAADKLARFLQLCDAHGLPVVSLVDTPGFMVGPDAERTATVRHFSRVFVAGANLRVPVLGVVLRKGYGLGAMAMVGGGFHVPVAMLAWPTGEIGAMGLEGAVRLGYRRELDAIEDPDARQRAFDELLAAAYDKGRAVNAASVFELDDVIDPADTRRWIRETLTLPVVPPSGGRHRFVDTW
ncbi:MAG TPA: carboxyl transferase domain-containing protein [Nocardioidaceae bacterium]|nr:carboxyl transferase domain-containing protein [Nocardioidaceae bacterium]